MRSRVEYPVCSMLLSLAVLALAAAPALAQEAAATENTAPTSQPATVATTLPEGAAQIEAVVIDVKGRAQHAPTGTAVTDAAAWQPVRMNDHYPAGTLIRTGLGSHVTLQFGEEEPYTVVMVERMSLASIASLYKTQAEKVGQVSVNYGAIRGGVSEGGLRSSFVVDSTVATLTKRGTWGFRMFVERGTGRYEISLADIGLVEVLNNITRQRQGLVSGQYVTQAMRRWIEQTSFDRTITLQDRFGLTNEEFQFKALYGGGLSVMDPAATALTYQIARPGFEQFAIQQVQQILQQQALQDLAQQRRLQDLLNPPPPGVINRPEGDFNSPFR